MNGRERILRIFKGQEVDRPAFWMGAPIWETQQLYFRHFGVETMQELSVALANDLYWVPAEVGSYRPPDGGAMFPADAKAPPFAACEGMDAVRRYPWPRAEYLDYTAAIAEMHGAAKRGQAVFGGPWCPVFQTAVDLFGMENLFIQMYLQPELVHAVITRIVEFYLEACHRLFLLAEGCLDVFFFANDLGSQRDLLLSPEMLHEFFLPGFQRLVAQAKKHGYPVVMHSCGAIARAIPMLIEIGIDGLHPLQSGAEGMEPGQLAEKYKDKLVFIGGIDTQQLLPGGTPRQIQAEVKRLYAEIGKRWIISPSHEGLLPDIPVQNILAVHDAAMTLA